MGIMQEFQQMDGQRRAQVAALRAKVTSTVRDFTTLRRKNESALRRGLADGRAQLRALVFGESPSSAASHRAKRPQPK